MRYAVGLVLLALVGCATNAPKPVLDADIMARQAAKTIERNTMTTLDEVHQELVDVTAQGNAAVLDAKKKEIVSPDGTVSVAEYDALLSEAATAQRNAEEQYAKDMAAIRLKLAQQFAAQRQLSELVSAYNNASGMSAETFEELLSASLEAAQPIVDKKLQAANKPNDPDKLDWDSIFKLVERRAFDTLTTKLTTPSP